VAALAEPMGVALHAVRRSGAGPGSRVAVLGVGPIGLGAVIWLKHLGAEHVVAVDLAPERLERAAAFGADAVVMGGRGDLAERLAEAHGVAERGLPATEIFIDAAGSPAALTEVLGTARRGACVVVVAVYKAPVTLDLSAMLHREISLVTSLAYPTELEEVVAFLSDNADRMAGYISDRYPMSQFAGAVERARRSDAAKVMVLVQED
jgi:threonine dehydrogenase-like Zn-dependent dehydrogenase